MGPGLCGRPPLQLPYVLIHLLRCMFRNVYTSWSRVRKAGAYSHRVGDKQENIKTRGLQIVSEVRGIAQGTMGLGKERTEGRGLQKEGKGPEVKRVVWLES